MRLVGLGPAEKQPEKVLDQQPLVQGQIRRAPWRRGEQTGHRHQTLLRRCRGNRSHGTRGTRSSHGIRSSGRHLQLLRPVTLWLLVWYQWALWW